MEFQRRTFLKSGGILAIGSLAGCTASLSKPDPTIIELTATEARAISNRENDNSFSITVQNTGDAGEIEVSLYWQMDENANPETIGFAHSSGWEFERQKTVYFDSDERREVRFTAEPPSNGVGYYFQLQATTAGARIRNNGGEGNVHVVMEYETSNRIPAQKESTVFFQEDETKEVTFNVKPAEGSEYEVTAEPVE